MAGGAEANKVPAANTKPSAPRRKILLTVIADRFSLLMFS